MIPILVFSLLQCVAFASTTLDPSNFAIGARPLAMGQAFTSIADDGSAIFTNPAGSSQGRSQKYISMSGNSAQDFPYVMAGGIAPLGDGSVGLGFAGFGAYGIKETTLVGITPEVTGGLGNYANATIVLNYSNDAKNIPLLDKIKTNFSMFKAGANVKLLNQGFSGTASFEGKAASGFDMDLGLIASISDEVKLGASIKNMLSGAINSDKIATSFNFGASRVFKNWNLLGALDIDFSKSALFKAGVEWAPLQMLVIRGGFSQKPSAAATEMVLTGGVGVNVSNFTFDYAYNSCPELSELVSHYFSIGWSPVEDRSVFMKKATVIPPLSAMRGEVTTEVIIQEVYISKKPIKQQKIEAYIALLKEKLKNATDPEQKKEIKQMLDVQNKRLARVIEQDEMDYVMQLIKEGILLPPRKDKAQKIREYINKLASEQALTDDQNKKKELNIMIKEQKARLNRALGITPEIKALSKALSQEAIHNLKQLVQTQPPIVSLLKQLGRTINPAMTKEAWPALKAMPTREAKAEKKKAPVIKVEAPATKAQTNEIEPIADEKIEDIQTIDETTLMQTILKQKNKATGLIKPK